jgi:hypothetical protein
VKRALKMKGLEKHHVSTSQDKREKHWAGLLGVYTPLPLNIPFQLPFPFPFPLDSTYQSPYHSPS